MGRIPSISGNFKFADYVKLAYFEQDLIWTNPESTPLEIISQKFPKFSNKDVRKELARCGVMAKNVTQKISTLSGGENQRVKLATELAKRDTGKTLFILDEPTTGLHFEDIRVLLKIINKLADKGNTIIVIEHNLDIVRNADHVIDLGPGGGREGGRIIAEGTPEEISQQDTPTARYLKKELENI